jgi:hypothetical protein
MSGVTHQASPRWTEPMQCLDIGDDSKLYCKQESHTDCRADGGPCLLRVAYTLSKICITFMANHSWLEYILPMHQLHVDHVCELDAV